MGDAIDESASRGPAEGGIGVADGAQNLTKAAPAGGKIALGIDAPLLLWLANSAAHQQRCHGPPRRFTVRDPLKAVRLEAL